MKRVLTIFFSTLIMFLSAQKNISVSQLPPPSEVTVLNLERYLKAHIIYGATPPHSNGKVLVFVPGIGTTAEIFLKKDHEDHGLFRKNTIFFGINKLYENAYLDGYKTVFLTLSPYMGVWDNGAYLAQILNQVLQSLSIEKVTLIAHGDGGRYAEVAMFDYRMKDKISRVVALGTPFWGTPLADIAQDEDHEWVINNGVWGVGTKLLTTYYNSLYFRPYFDLNQNNQFYKFYTFGAWDYNSKRVRSYSTLNKYGGIIDKYIFGAKANDGFTVYHSTIRPMSYTFGSETDERGAINHFNLVDGEYMWADIMSHILILPEIDSMGYNKYTPSSKDSDNIYQSISNYQIISSANKSAYAWITSKTKEVEVDILYDKSDSDISFLGSNSKLILKGIKKSNSLKSEAHTSLRLQGGENFRIQSQGNYLAFIKDGLDQPMIYQVKKLGNKTFLELNFPNLPTTKLKSLSLTASLSYLGDLEGRGNRGSKESVFFKEDSGKYILDVSNHIKGIYNITIQAEIPNEYRRSLITGFVLTEDGSTISDSNVATDKLSTLDYQLIGNPVSKSTVLKLPVGLLGKVSLKVYDMQGSLVKDFQVTANTLISIGSYLYQLPKGAYVLTIQTGKGTKNINFIR